MTWRNHTIIFSIFYLEKKLHTIVSFKTTSKYFYLKQFSQKSIYRLIEEYIILNYDSMIHTSIEEKI